jgi:hypothetical protein
MGGDPNRPSGPLRHDLVRQLQSHPVAVVGRFDGGPLKIDIGGGSQQGGEAPKPGPEVLDHIKALVMLANGLPGCLTLGSYGQIPGTGSALPPKHCNVIPDAEGAALLVQTAHAWALEPGRNVYMALSLARADIGRYRKPGGKDIQALLGLVVDFDDHDANRWETRVPLAPSMVYETSPSRFQAFFLFDQPIHPDEARGLASGLKTATGADSCTSDIAHVWRIPGFLNWPNLKKILEGRATTPCLVRVVRPWDGTLIAPKDLRSALPNRALAAPRNASGGNYPGQSQTANLQAPQAAPIPADLAALIENGVPQGKRSDAFFAVVGRLRGSGYDADQIFDLLVEHPDGISEKYRARGEDALRREIDRAYGKVSDRPATEVFAPAVEAEAWVDELNRTYFFTMIGGSAVVCREEDRTLRLIGVNDFKASLANKKTPCGKVKGAAWFVHPARREYLGGLVFLPQRPAPAGCYNTWRGWAIEPAPGQWPRLGSHIRDVICAGNAEHFQWLLNWCAHLFQRPWEKGEVAVVLRGGEGTGKGTFARALGQIVGVVHYLQVFNPKHLVGQFNAHLADKVLLFADEAFFAGDKSSNGVLKGLITEHEIQIERKGIDAVRGRNLLHIVMATNERWAVPASNDARRYFVLDIGNERQNDETYFSALNQEMEEGGLAAFFQAMLARDITGFDHRRAPKTRGLLDQKLHSLSGVRRWWFDKLASAYESSPEQSGTGDWKTEVAKNDLFDEFKSWRRDQRSESYQLESAQGFWKTLHELCDFKEFRPAQGNRGRMVRLPNLKTARAAFDAWIREAVDWEVMG